jgi:hypothetical protein
MKKFLTSLMVVAALAVGATAHADTIERDSDGNLTINMFASLIESFRVAISSDDLVAGGPSDGIIDLNGGLLGFDALASIGAAGCVDDTSTAPTYAGATSCALGGAGTSASDSHLAFSVSMDVLVEISGPGTVSLAATLQGAGVGLTSFTASSVQFDGAASASVTNMEDQDTEVLSWDGQAPLNAGPDFDETIVVAVTKQ